MPFEGNVATLNLEQALSPDAPEDRPLPQSERRELFERLRRAEQIKAENRILVGPDVLTQLPTRRGCRRLPPDSLPKGCSDPDNTRPGMKNDAGSASRDRDANVIRWLLEEDQPVVRYAALVDLLGRKEADTEVKSTRSKITRVGWAYDQLRTQGPKGFWEPREPTNLKEWVDFLYYPKYLSTNWRALVLADFGLDASDPRIKRVADLLFEFKLRLSSPFNFFYEEACVVGNTARMLTRFGYSDDFRVRKLYDWLLEDQRQDGGWNCSPGTPGTLDVWEPLAAFASLPRSKRSPRVEAAISRGAEFYLRRRLFNEGPRYAPWFRLHYPNHYYYDILVGLDVLTQLGFAGDRRLRPALKILVDKRQPDGTWRIDRVHPDVSGPKAAQYRRGVTQLRIEKPGKPSKWITLKALRVLKRVEDGSQT